MSTILSYLKLVVMIVAVLSGMTEAPVWLLAVITLAYAGASYMYLEAEFPAVSAHIAKTAATPEDARRLTGFYAPMLTRELALAAVKCGLGYVAGFWLTQFFAAPPMST
ncbi:MAG: hypothetical protein ACFCUN_03645 [Hyphomicrobiaceae bacterium]